MFVSKEEWDKEHNPVGMTLPKLKVRLDVALRVMTKDFPGSDRLTKEDYKGWSSYAVALAKELQRREKRDKQNTEKKGVLS